MMKIVKPLEENDIDSTQLEKIQFFKGSLGVKPSSVKTISYHPKIADVFINLNIAVMECKWAVALEFKRLIGYKSGFYSGCLYYQAQKILGAESFGSSKKRLDKIWKCSNSTAFSNEEKTALDFACTAASVPNKVTKKLVSQFKRFLNDSMSSALEDLLIKKGEKYLKETTNWTPGKHRV